MTPDTVAAVSLKFVQQKAETRVSSLQIISILRIKKNIKIIVYKANKPAFVAIIAK